MKRPRADDMRTAAEWLKYNEGTGDEQDACLTVSQWLEAQATAAELTEGVAEAAKSLGVSRTAVREQLKRFRAAGGQA